MHTLYLSNTVRGELKRRAVMDGSTARSSPVRQDLAYDRSWLKMMPYVMVGV
jgi:hypothetical protein